MPFTNITENQINGLLEKSKIKGCICGLLVWYRGKEKTIFIDIENVLKIKNENNKSININKHLESMQEIKAKKKIKYFDYDFEKFLSK